jgi:aspartyl protease family protein
VLITQDADGFFTANGEINGSTVSFLVDTGSSWVAFSKSVARRLGIQYSEGDFNSSVLTAGGRVDVAPVNLERVKVGNIVLEDVRGAVIDKDIGSEVLLGMSFLGEVEIASEGQALELRYK